MSAPPTTTGETITDKRQLVEYLAAGCKSPEAWRIGTEHEKFVFRRSDLRRVPYEGPDGIRALLEGLTRFGWKPASRSPLVRGNARSRSSPAASSSSRARRSRPCTRLAPRSAPI